MSEWQDISTAPMDGTPVDIWCHYGGSGGERFPDAEYIRGAWRIWIGTEWTIVDGTPSYWMPLPDPPQ